MSARKSNIKAARVAALAVHIMQLMTADRPCPRSPRCFSKSALDISVPRFVVVIDDDPLVLEAMAGLLQSWGYRVLAAPSGDAVMEALDEELPPDLIISDYRLAGETGIDVIERLQGAFPAPIPAVLISGATAPEDLRFFSESGYRTLHKPVTAGALRVLLDEV